MTAKYAIVNSQFLNCHRLHQTSNPMTRAVVLAPIGAFGSAAPVSQSGVLRRVKPSLVFYKFKSLNGSCSFRHTSANLLGLSHLGNLRP